MKDDNKRLVKKNIAVKADKEYRIPNEAVCSPEFPQGCIALGDD